MRARSDRGELLLCLRRDSTWGKINSEDGKENTSEVESVEQIRSTRIRAAFAGVRLSATVSTHTPITSQTPSRRGELPINAVFVLISAGFVRSAIENKRAVDTLATCAIDRMREHAAHA